MSKILRLSGLIHQGYGSETALANAMGWSRQRLNRITNGKKIPDIIEVGELAKALGTSFSLMANIFLPSGSTNVDNQEELP